MRVTKVIREYVEREVSAKFQPKIDAVFNEYMEEKRALEQRLQDVADEADRKAREIVAASGFSLPSYCRDSGLIGVQSRSLEKKEEYDRLSARKHELVAAKNKAVEDILLELELGETTKSELRDAIERIVVDV